MTSKPCNTLLTCPQHKNVVARSGEVLVCSGGCKFPIIRYMEQEIIDFGGNIDRNSTQKNLLFYNGQEQNERYRNFLLWLFSTFNTDEESFRKMLLSRLAIPQGGKVLVTGCGNGDDLAALAKHYPSKSLDIHAQDISPEMVWETAKTVTQIGMQQVTLSVSDATNLPYQDGTFDAVFHFGGINFMPDVRVAISEMARVSKNAGAVGFGDESIAPWLRDSEYYRMLVENNSLWSTTSPLHLSPPCATKVNATWILENCFYFIDFVKDLQFPSINIDIPHIGVRGGSIRTRYYIKLEGVTEEARNIAKEEAQRQGISIHTWLDAIIKQSRHHN